MNYRLPKSQLAIRDGALLKVNSDGSFIASHPLEEITDVRIAATREYVFPAVTVFVTTSLAVIAKLYVPWEGLAWTVAVLLIAVGSLFLMGAFGHQIVVVTKRGTVGYTLNDNFEDGAGFVVTLQTILSKSREQRPEGPSAG